MLTAGFWLCSQVHLVVLPVVLLIVVVVPLLGGLTAKSLVYQGQQSFNQLVERARMLLARAQKVINEDKSVKVSTTFFVIVPTINVTNI